MKFLSEKPFSAVSTICLPGIYVIFG